MNKSFYLLIFSGLLLGSCASLTRQFVAMVEDPTGEIYDTKITHAQPDDRSSSQSANIGMGSTPYINLGVHTQNRIMRLGEISGFFTLSPIKEPELSTEFDKGIHNFETQINISKTLFTKRGFKEGMVSIKEMPAYTILLVDYLNMWNVFVGYNYMRNGFNLNDYWAKHIENGEASAYLHVSPQGISYAQNVQSLSCGISYQRFFNTRLDGLVYEERSTGKNAQLFTVSLQADMAFWTKLGGGSFEYWYTSYDQTLDKDVHVYEVFDPAVEFKKNKLGITGNVEWMTYGFNPTGLTIGVFLYTGLKPGNYYRIQNLIYVRGGLRFGLGWRT